MWEQGRDSLSGRRDRPQNAECFSLPGCLPLLGCQGRVHTGGQNLLPWPDGRREGGTGGHVHAADLCGPAILTATGGQGITARQGRAAAYRF